MKGKKDEMIISKTVPKAINEGMVHILQSLAILNRWMWNMTLEIKTVLR